MDVQVLREDGPVDVREKGISLSGEPNVRIFIGSERHDKLLRGSDVRGETSVTTAVAGIFLRTREPLSREPVF
jgi:hypothetical protein